MITRILILFVLLIIARMLSDISNKLDNLPNYNERLDKMEKVLQDMNTLDFYNKGKYLKLKTVGVKTK